MEQKPLRMVAEPFTPGINSNDGWEVEGVLATEIKEFYFTTRSNKDSPRVDAQIIETLKLNLQTILPRH